MKSLRIRSHCFTPYKSYHIKQNDMIQCFMLSPSTSTVSVLECNFHIASPLELLVESAFILARNKASTIGGNCWVSVSIPHIHIFFINQMKASPPIMVLLYSSQQLKAITRKDNVHSHIHSLEPGICKSMQALPSEEYREHNQDPTGSFSHDNFFHSLPQSMLFFIFSTRIRFQMDHPITPISPASFPHRQIKGRQKKKK